METVGGIIGLLLTGVIAGAAAMSLVYERRRRRIEAARVTITDNGIYQRSAEPIYIYAKIAAPFEEHWTIASVRVTKPPASDLISQVGYSHRDEWNNPAIKPIGWKRDIKVENPQTAFFLHPQSPSDLEVTWTLRSLSSRRDTIRFTSDIKIRD